MNEKWMDERKMMVASFKLFFIILISEGILVI